MLRIVAFCAALALACPAASAGDPYEMAASFGLFSVDHNGSSKVAGLEVRWPEWRWGLRPAAGVLVTNDVAGYVYGGFRYDIRLSEKWTLTPHTAAGLYVDGDDSDLGGPIEFRSGLDLTLRVSSELSVFASYSHISNASIFDDNPGTNPGVVGIVWTP
jgi:lipid A 3-O-deacylase